MNKSDACREVDMITLMSALWRRAWIIALISVVLGAICFAWARFLITPTYEASALMYVNNTQDPGKPISNSELSAAQSLVDTYMVILSSRTTLDQIRSAAKLTYTDKQLTKMIRAQAVNGTEVFEITVASTAGGQEYCQHGHSGASGPHCRRSGGQLCAGRGLCAASHLKGKPQHSALYAAGYADRSYSQLRVLYPAGAF